VVVSLMERYSSFIRYPLRKRFFVLARLMVPAWFTVSCCTVPKCMMFMLCKLAVCVETTEVD